MKRGEARERILETGEALVRQHGLNGVSFREIADAIGVKSASVHYHFSTKDDFALALTERYSDRFLEAARTALDPGDTIADQIGAYAGLFLAAYADDGKMCLCGILAAEATDLPESVRKTIGAFFARNLTLLESVLGDPSRARFVLTSLEGAMLLARAEGSSQHLDRIAEDLTDRYRNRP